MENATKVNFGSLPQLLLFAMMLLSAVRAAGQKATVDYLDPTTLTDVEGNKADSDSNISFVPIKGQQDYKVGEQVPTTIAVAAWFSDLSSAFARSALSGDFPHELVKTLVKGDTSKFDPQKVAKDYLGYLIAVVVGVLLLLVIPIAGCCFCLCRCRKRCGGCRKFDDPYQAGFEDECNRKTTIALFTVFLVLAIAGTVLMVLANHNVTTQLYDMNHGGLDKLDDIPKFVDNTVNQAKVAIFGKFNFTVDVIQRDLTNIGFLVGQPARKYVITDSKLDEVYTGILDLEVDATKILELLRDYNGIKQKFEDKTKTVAADFVSDSFKASLDQELALKSFTEGAQYRAKMEAGQKIKLPDVTRYAQSLEKFLNASMSSIIEKSRSALNDVPEKIKNQTASRAKDIENQFSKYSKDMQNAIDLLKTFRDNVLKSYRSNDPKKSAENGLATVSKYDKFRWFGGHGLAVLALLTEILLILAVSFGIFGGNASVHPSERSNISNIGGNLLLAGSVFAFFTAWLLILPTIPIFIIGAPTEAFGCGAVRDPSILDKLLNEDGLFNDKPRENGTWLGNQLFPDKGADLKISTFFDVCSSGGTLYKAFQSDILNMNNLLDFDQNFDIKSELSKFNVDFTGTTLQNDDLKDFLKLMKNITQLGDLMEQAVANSAPVLTADFESYLTKRSQNSSDARQAEMANLLKELKAFKPKTALLDAEVAQLKSITAEFKAITNPNSGQKLSERTEKLRTKLATVGVDLSTTAQSAFETATTDFANRIRQILNQSAYGLESSVKSEIGVCKPLYNVYEDLLQKSTCDYIVGSLNAWTSAMGMTAVFLVLTLCVSCALSKHLYRIDIKGGHETNTLSNNGIDERIVPSAPLFHEAPGHFNTSKLFNNKVYHADS